MSKVLKLTFSVSMLFFCVGLLNSLLYAAATISVQDRLHNLQEKIKTLSDSTKSLGSNLEKVSGALQKVRSSLKILTGKKLNELTFEELSALLKTPSEVKPLVEKELEDIAETKGYGYKTGNLQKLSELVAQLDQFQKLTGYTVRVPDFVGISSKEVQLFLDKGLGIDKGAGTNTSIAARWEALVRDYRANLATYIATKKFPDGFLANLHKDVFKPIEDAFNEKIAKVADHNPIANMFLSTGPTTPVKTLQADTLKDLDGLISKVTGQRQRLMVRSTGKEDTKKLANAGGNESVANVTPSNRSILEAMKIVVCSYFGEKSVTQRLDAGDKTLFDHPFTPVLIQRMIGEEPGGAKKLADITQCGVMYTEEPEGGFLKLGKTFTSGITLMQIAYGHNEGVVNSLVACDTIYIDETGIIYPVIREKTSRLVPHPTEGGKLLECANPRTFAKNPALFPPTIVMLKLLARILEDYYQGPMDVEFVIKDEITKEAKSLGEKEERERVIYVVQARPIVYDPTLPMPRPSYLTDINNANFTPKVSGKSIGAAGGALRFFTNKQEIIIKKTINEALTTYLDPVTDRIKVKAIVIGKMAPSTSHEAAQFRGALKPVLQVNELEKVEKFFEKPNPKVIVDVQQQLIGQWQGAENSVEDLLKEVKAPLVKSAQRGWINYPIPLLLSLAFKPYVQDQALNEASIKKVLSLNDDAFKTVSEQMATTRFTIKELITIIKKTRDLGELRRALTKIALFLLKQLKPYNDVIDAYSDLKQEVSLLNSCFLLSAQHIQKVFHYMPETDEYSKRLYAIRFLEALLFQSSREVDALGGYSYGKCLKAVRERSAEKKKIEEAVQGASKSVETPISKLLGEVKIHSAMLEGTKKIIEPQKRIATVMVAKSRARRAQKALKTAALLSMLGNHAFTDELKQYWQNFIMVLPQQDYDNLATLLGDLHKFDLLELWLHTSFAKTYEEVVKRESKVVGPPGGASLLPDSKVAEAIEKTLLDEKKSVSTFLEILAQKKKLLDEFKSKAIAEPKSFNKHWGKFNADILNYFLDESIDGFIKAFRAAESLGKLAAIKLMEELVAKFDEAIKALTGSSEFKVVPTEFKWVSTGTSIADRISKEKDHLVAFKLMLQSYLALLQKWYTLLSPGDLLDYKDENQRAVPTTTALMEIATTLQELPTNVEAQLHATPGFNVSASMIGTGTNFKRGKPQTHEELFTFTHQSLLMIMSVLLKKQMRLEQLPHIVQDLVKSLAGSHYFVCYGRYFYTEYKTISLVGIGFQSDTVTLTFNYPQLMHSAIIKAIYKKSKSENLFTLEIAMFGLNHYNRWEQCTDYLLLRSKMADIHVQQPLILGKGFEMSWQFTLKPDGDVLTITKTAMEKHIEPVIDFFKILAVLAGAFEPKATEHILDMKKTAEARAVTASDDEVSRQEKMNYYIYKADNLKNKLLNDIQFKKFESDAARAIIDLSDNGSRAHWLLPQALALLQKHKDILDVKLLKQLVSIADKIVRIDGSYASETEIFLLRKQSGMTPVGKYYTLAPENYMNNFTTSDIQRLRNPARLSTSGFQDAPLAMFYDIINLIWEKRDLIDEPLAAQLFLMLDTHQERFIGSYIGYAGEYVFTTLVSAVKKFTSMQVQASELTKSMVVQDSLSTINKRLSAMPETKTLGAPLTYIEKRHENFLLRTDYLAAFKELERLTGIDAKKVNEVGLDIVQHGMNHRDTVLQEKAVELFNKMFLRLRPEELLKFLKEKDLDLRLVSTLLKSETSYVRTSGIILLALLVTDNIALIKGSTHLFEAFLLRTNCLEIFRELESSPGIDQAKVIEIGLNFVQRGVNHSNITIQKNAAALFGEISASKPDESLRFIQEKDQDLRLVSLLLKNENPMGVKFLEELARDKVTLIKRNASLLDAIKKMLEKDFYTSGYGGYGYGGGTLSLNIVVVRIMIFVLRYLYDDRALVEIIGNTIRRSLPDFNKIMKKVAQEPEATQTRMIDFFILLIQRGLLEQGRFISGLEHSVGSEKILNALILFTLKDERILSLRDVMRDFIKDTLRALQYSAYGLDAANLSKKCIKLLIEDDAYWNKIKAIVTEAYDQTYYYSYSPLNADQVKEALRKLAAE